MSDLKIAKLTRFLEALDSADSANIIADQVAQTIAALVSALEDWKKSVTGDINLIDLRVESNKEELIKRIDKVSMSLESRLESLSSIQNTERSTMIRELSTEIANVRDLITQTSSSVNEDALVARAADVAKIQMLPNIETQFEELRQEITTMNKEIAASIQKRGRYMTKDDLDRAISILDSRSSYLINKVNELSASSGTGNVSYGHGSGAPSSTPTSIGQGYVDDDTKNIYIATGTSSSSDWNMVTSFSQ